MAKLSLVDKTLVDLGGVDVRMASDITQLALTEQELAGDLPPQGFIDLGEVEYDGVLYYASIMRRPLTDDDNNEPDDDAE